MPGRGRGDGARKGLAAPRGTPGARAPSAPAELPGARQARAGGREVKLRDTGVEDIIAGGHERDSCHLARMLRSAFQSLLHREESWRKATVATAMIGKAQFRGVPAPPVSGSGVDTRHSRSSLRVAHKFCDFKPKDQMWKESSTIGQSLFVRVEFLCNSSTR